MEVKYFFFFIFILVSSINSIFTSGSIKALTDVMKKNTIPYSFPKPKAGAIPDESILNFF